MNKIISEESIAKAFKTLKLAMEQDKPSVQGSYAHSWHCNIAMMCFDAIGMDKATSSLSFEDAHRIGNEAATKFMKLCFDVETNAQIKKDVLRRNKWKRFGLPLIGAGLAGGDWNKILQIINDVLGDEDITIIKYKRI